MRFLCALGLGVLVPVGIPAAPRPTPEPIDVGTVEHETVRLLLLDVMVRDDAGRPVPGLTIDDFEVVARGKLRAVDTLDVACSPERGLGTDPRSDVAAATSEAISDETSDATSDTTRRIVLALDYQHLDMMQRVDVLERAEGLVKRGELAGEVMVAALNGGLRIEQPFTADSETVLRALRRMQYDISLWQPDFSHVNEHGFVDGLTALLDVVGAFPGTKALVLFSAMQDVPLDLQFQEIAAVAAASRCFLYPVDAAGLRTYPSGLENARPASGAG